MDSNLILITGDDQYEKERQLNAIKMNFGILQKGINYAQIDKENLNTLINEVTTFPFGYDKKFILISLTQKRKAKENEDETEKSKEESLDANWFDDELVESILQSLDTNVIVFYGSFALNSKLANFVKKNGKIIECNKSNGKNKKDIIDWLIKEFSKYHKNISYDAALYMIEACGQNKQLLYNEIQKLIDYTKDGLDVTKQDIDLLCYRTPEIIVFDLTDAAGSRNITKVLAILDELIKQKEPLQKILILIARHFKKLLQTKICMLQKKDVAMALELKFPSLVTKYKEQASKFSIDEIKDILLKLSDLDVSSKFGEMDLKIGLEVCLIEALTLSQAD